MIKSLFLKLVGSSLIILYLYLRFLHKRLPRLLFIWHTVDTIHFDINYNVLALIIISLILYSTLLFKQIVIVIDLNLPIKFMNAKITRLLDVFLTFIKDSLFSIYSLIYSNIPNAYEHLRSFCLFTYRIFSYKEKYIVILELFVLSTIYCCFFIDVFFFFELYYFYKSLVLFFITPFIRLWLYLIEDWVHNMEEITKVLKVEHTVLANGQDHFVFSVEGNFDAETKELILLEDSKEYLSMVPLKGFLNSYKTYENKYRPKFLLILYSLYLVGWLYVLYINIYLFL